MTPRQTQASQDLLDAIERSDDLALGRALALGASPATPAPIPYRPPALHWAATLGNLQAMSALLAAGANPRAVDIHGHGLIHWASRGPNLECLKLAIDAGADIDAASSLGEQEAFFAAAQNPAALKVLIDAGLDVNHRDGAGQTLLMGAARCGQLESAQLLIGAGAHLETRSRTGMSAMAEAAFGRRPDMVALLAQAGADLESVLALIDQRPLHTQDPLTPSEDARLRRQIKHPILEQIAAKEAQALADASLGAPPRRGAPL